MVEIGLYEGYDCGGSGDCYEVEQCCYGLQCQLCYDVGVEFEVDFDCYY